ncbi:MAG: hypothetical protein IPK50_14575 [Fibrobacterota bacterium]|nr:MAG: hypothetical protein IPK50_14575 [Fibrobacterota bacterium]
MAANALPKNAVFLSKDTVDGKVVGVYIEPDRNSRLYQKLTIFELNGFDSLDYQYSLDQLRENGLKLERVRNLLPWRQWVNLERYQGKFHAYKPCDFLFHYQWSINDTTLIDWTGEGPFAAKVLGQKKLDAKTYQIRYTGLLDQGGTELTIHLVDPAKGIAVFRKVSSIKDTSYLLMIAADKIRSVPLIVNHCPTGKRTEFSFEDLDGKEWMEK